MAKTYYNVTITSLTGLGSDGGGFIDNKTIEQYMAAGSTPTTVAQSIDKERANIRYGRMIGKLGMMANLYVSNIAATGANAIAAPTSFNFTLESEHGDGPLSTISNAVVYTGNAAIKRCIAHSLIENFYETGDYYDPSISNGITANGTFQTAPRVGVRIERMTSNAVANSISVAEAAITVTKI